MRDLCEEGCALHILSFCTSAHTWRRLSNGCRVALDYSIDRALRHAILFGCMLVTVPLRRRSAAHCLPRIPGHLRVRLITSIVEGCTQAHHTNLIIAIILQVLTEAPIRSHLGSRSNDKFQMGPRPWPVTQGVEDSPLPNSSQRPQCGGRCVLAGQSSSKVQA